MTIQTLEYILAAALALALCRAAVTDWLRRDIANHLNLAIALAAPLYWYASGMWIWPDVVFQIGLATIVFAVFLALFAINAMGGGDVKLLTALALWISPPDMLQLLFVMALLGGVLTLVMMLRHRLSRSEQPLEIPYGIAIALAGLWSLGERYLNQFA